MRILRDTFIFAILGVVFGLFTIPLIGMTGIVSFTPVLAVVGFFWGIFDEHQARKEAAAREKELEESAHKERIRITRQLKEDIDRAYNMSQSYHALNNKPVLNASPSSDNSFSAINSALWSLSEVQGIVEGLGTN